MGICLPKSQEPPAKQPQKVDVIVAKLKVARDTIKNFISLKSRDLNKIDEQLKQKYVKYEGDKRKLVPLLQAKKQLTDRINNAENRRKVIEDTISQVQLKKLDVDMIGVLDEGNQYIKNAQQEMQKRDWRNVLEEAKKKYEIQWPDDREEVEEDPAFQQMWNQLGGNQLKKKMPVKKQVYVDNHVQKQQQQQRELNIA